METVDSVPWKSTVGLHDIAISIFGAIYACIVDISTLVLEDGPLHNLRSYKSIACRIGERVP